MKALQQLLLCCAAAGRLQLSRPMGLPRRSMGLGGAPETVKPQAINPETCARGALNPRPETLGRTVGSKCRDGPHPLDPCIFNEGRNR